MSWFSQKTGVKNDSVALWDIPTHKKIVIWGSVFRQKWMKKWFSCSVDKHFWNLDTGMSWFSQKTRVKNDSVESPHTNKIVICNHFFIHFFLKNNPLNWWVKKWFSCSAHTQNCVESPHTNKIVICGGCFSEKMSEKIIRKPSHTHKMPILCVCEAF